MLVLSPSGRFLCSSINRPHTCIVDLETGKTVVNRTPQEPFAEYNLETCAFSRDGTKALFFRQRQWIDVEAEAQRVGPVRVEILSLPSFERLRVFHLEERKETLLYQPAMRVSPQLDAIYSLGYGDDFEWDLKTGKYKDKVALHPSYETTLEDWTFAPDGSLLAAEYENKVVLYNTSTRKRLRIFKLPSSWPNTMGKLTFSPDNSLLARSSDGEENRECCFLNVQNGRVSWSCPTSVLSFAPDSKRVALLVDAQIQVREAHTGKLLRVLSWPPQRKVQWLGWTPDGNSVLAAEPQGTVWRLRAR